MGNRTLQIIFLFLRKLADFLSKTDSDTPSLDKDHSTEFIQIFVKNVNLNNLALLFKRKESDGREVAEYTGHYSKAIMNLIKDLYPRGVDCDSLIIDQKYIITIQHLFQNLKSATNQPYLVALCKTRSLISRNATFLKSLNEMQLDMKMPSGKEIVYTLVRQAWAMNRKEFKKWCRASLNKIKSHCSDEAFPDLKPIADEINTYISDAETVYCKWSEDQEKEQESKEAAEEKRRIDDEQMRQERIQRQTKIAEEKRLSSKRTCVNS